MRAAERHAARQAGAQHYYTGKPCVRGHVAERHTGSGICVVCRLENVRKNRETESGKETSRRSAREHWLKYREDKDYKKRNSDRARRWLAANPSTPERRKAAVERQKRWTATERGRQSKAKYYARINVRLANSLRGSLRNALKNNHKKGSAIVFLGCSIEHLKGHLEKQFTHGMSWDNYGLWHVDHIRPLCSFDLQSEHEQAAACHYSNLQPLWAVENIRKGGRWRVL